MIKEPNMSVEQPHSLGAVLKGAILLIFFVFGVTTYAQSYNAPISYRVSGTTQSTNLMLPNIITISKMQVSTISLLRIQADMMW